MIGERGYIRRSDDCADIAAQLDIESGTHFRAAAKRSALESAAATRTATTEGKSNV